MIAVSNVCRRSFGILSRTSLLQAAGGDPPQTMTPARGREMIDFARAAFQVSIRRACRAVPACRATYHYRSRRPEQAPLRKRIREIAETRMRYGYATVSLSTKKIKGLHENDFIMASKIDRTFAS
jgi:hypothetical protein